MYIDIKNEIREMRKKQNADGETMYWNNVYVPGLIGIQLIVILINYN